ncbi:hypothetical protein [Alicyclobacillus ferrooxydans]|uniref:Uncharacterized protein n=1 Tax=Alicyclobacillus ferrooxydans TaxID=471514 RepID=A0A0P9GH42_9BACL|nr:hypothetical protein [Alicyclobacillus ferrooxydans]KPV39336.1 hypothetical protein AN477_22865 [Alicyclobacillus ferrooxydans]
MDSPGPRVHVDRLVIPVVIRRQRVGHALTLGQPETHAVTRVLRETHVVTQIPQETHVAIPLPLEAPVAILHQPESRAATQVRQAARADQRRRLAGEYVMFGSHFGRRDLT